MRSQLMIEGKNSPELLERLLRVVRHRGFAIQTLNAQTSENGLDLQLTLTVTSEREISLLTKQLQKIFAITNVSTLHQERMVKASA